MIELTVIFALIACNGVFAMTEIALVSSRRARLKQQAEEGHRGALQALKLLENPERFLSSVQIGITLVGVFAGAYGGATVASRLTPLLQEVAFLAQHAQKISIAIVVTGITYLSLVIGELVPKGLALRHAEAIAGFMSRPMLVLSKATAPVVWLLEASTRMVLRLFGPVGTATYSAATREEMQVLVREGIITGSVDESESDMVEGVLDLHEELAEEIMQPRPKVLFLGASETTGEVWPRVAASRQTVFPVYEDSRDNIIGMVSLHQLFASAASGANGTMASLASPPLFVAENQPALSLLGTLRASQHGAALVTDEFGTIRGMISIDDLAEEIVGALHPDDHQQQQALFRATGEDTWLVDGAMEIDAVIERLPELDDVVEKEAEPFQTLAGFIVHRLDRLPVEGETFQAGPFEFDVIDMDRQRIDKVLIRRLAQPAPAEAQQAG